MTDMFQRLAAPFPPARVSWRVGSTTQDKKKGMALAYIDARDVMERFDAVCGPDGWERRHPHVTGTTTCEIALWVPERDRWVVKADGAGDTAVEAEKGSLSDSFKRAAVNWGVGRYLYDLPTPWVALDQHKKIEEAELRKLEGLLGRNAAQTQRPAQTPVEKPEETGVYIACKAAIDVCGEDRAALDAWGKGNAASMAKIEKEQPAVYRAVKTYYSGKLKAAPAADKPPPSTANDFGLQGDDIPAFA